MKMKHNTGNVKECPKGISLETNFRDILQKNDKAINFFYIFFLYFPYKLCQNIYNIVY